MVSPHRLFRLLVAWLAGLGMLLLVVTFSPLVSWWSRALAGPWNDPGGEVLIVLASGAIDPETLSPDSYWRAVYADRAWRGGGFRQVLVCGAGTAPLMRDYLVGRGVPASAILVDNASTSTRENAQNAKRLLAGTPGGKVLLTSDYHMFRAHRAFLKAGLAVRPRPFPDGLKRYNGLLARWPVFTDLVVETVKIVYYFARGWI